MKQLEWKMKEVDLYLPAKKYFENLGFAVGAEIPCIGMALCDIGCFKNNIVIAAEMKTSLSKRLLRQAYYHGILADYVYAVIPTTPRDLSYAKRLGIGVLKVVNDKIIELLKPEKNNPFNNHKEKFIFEIKESIKWCPDLIAGKPNMKGEGPRIDCQKRVDEYLKENPKASWKEIWNNVDNHYCSVQSMVGAIYK